MAHRSTFIYALSMSIRATVQTPAGVGEIRDLEGLDIESIVRYWHTSTKDHLDFLGVDLGRLGTERQTYDRFLVALPLGDPNQKTLGFSIYLDGAFAGYTLLNRYTPLDNYSHWHITNPALRRSGLSTALYPHRIKTYFDLRANRAPDPSDSNAQRRSQPHARQICPDR
jgi:hypothetical protein